MNLPIPCLQPTGSRRSAQQCSQMALDIVKLYVSLLSEFFSLSDAAVMQRNGNDASPKLLPRHSNSLTTAHFLIKILIEIHDCANEVTGMDIVPEATSNLRNLMESVRWKFGEVLIRAWLRGCCLAPCSYVLLITVVNRCNPFPPSRDVDTFYSRSFCDTVHVIAGHLSETSDHVCIKNCGRNRVIVNLFVVSDYTTGSNPACVYDQDHESVPGRDLRIFRWLGSSDFTRVDCDNGDLWFESAIADKTVRLE